MYNINFLSLLHPIGASQLTVTHHPFILLVKNTLSEVIIDTSIKTELTKPEYAAKPLANFIFREVIEDAHSKYGISRRI